MADAQLDWEAAAVGLVVGGLLLVAGQRWVDRTIDDLNPLSGGLLDG